MVEAQSSENGSELKLLTVFDVFLSKHPGTEYKWFPLIPGSDLIPGFTPLQTWLCLNLSASLKLGSTSRSVLLLLEQVCLFGPSDVPGKASIPQLTLIHEDCVIRLAFRST
jgi:hypothetical protein